MTRIPLRDRAAVALFRATDARGKRRGTHAGPAQTAVKPLSQRLGGVPPAFVSRPGPQDLAVTEHALPSGAVVRCYAPRSAPEVLRPALLFFHGGGWIWGSTDTFDPFLRRAAAELGAVVVGVDYRLAPEHVFPAAIEDCASALEWLRASAGELGIDVQWVAVMGESAGANLAAAVALRDRDAGGAPGLAAQVLVYPFTDLTLSDAWSQAYRGPGLTTEDCRQLAALYLGDSDGALDQRASPHHAASLAGLPPALVITAELDPLRDQGRAYAAALREAGVPSTHLDFPGVPHGFFGADRLLVSAARAQRAAVEHLAKHLTAVGNLPNR